VGHQGKRGKGKRKLKGKNRGEGAGTVKKKKNWGKNEGEKEREVGNTLTPEPTRALGGTGKGPKGNKSHKDKNKS